MIFHTPEMPNSWPSDHVGSIGTMHVGVGDGFWRVDGSVDGKFGLSLFYDFWW